MGQPLMIGGFSLSSEDIFDDLSTVMDPERAPTTLADLNVLSLDRVWLEKTGPRHGVVTVSLLPTVPHCHLMMLIALSVRSRLHDVLPPYVRWKVRVAVVPGSHIEAAEIEKRVNDKERVCNALEDPLVMRQVRKLTDPYADCA